MSEVSRGIILAAGEGTRMNSSLPKVCHRCFGEPMITHVIRGLKKAQIEEIVAVVGAGKQQVENHLPGDVRSVEQHKQKGTGDAVRVALEKGEVADDSPLVVTCGDIPGVRPETYSKVLSELRENDVQLVLLAVKQEDPRGYGRVVTSGKNRVKKIVEQKDATAKEKKIKLVNTGIIAGMARTFRQHLSDLSPDNAAGEYYLTDIVEMVAENGDQVGLVEASDSWQVSGINTRRRLVEFEREGYRQKLRRLSNRNITVHDPDRVKIGPWVELAGDNVLEGDIRISGDTKIGEKTVITGNSVIKNSAIGADNFIRFSHINSVRTGKSVQIGPYCHLRPGTEVANDVRLGNFVEVKNSQVESDTNIAHLSYVGDTDVGRNVNVGAGTITCNYDGYEKHKTVIGDNVFVGSNCELIAPVKVGEGAMIGAGSTVTETVPPNSLAISRTPQENRENWVKETWKPRKEEENDQDE